jgi:Zn-dependent protease with chaperone function
MMDIDAVFFDGETARDNAVRVRHVGSNLEFLGDTVPLTRWSIAGLHPIDPPTPGQPFRITHASKPGARLIVKDQTFIDRLVAQNSALKGGYTFKHWGQVFGWTAAGLAGLAGLAYIFMTVLPHYVAGMLPKSLRDSAGEQVVKALTDGSRLCQGQGSQESVSALVQSLSESGVDLPPVGIEIYDMSLVNAFATPGGRIILTRGLIDAADDANEVVGVLAHEYGHVFHLHPEAQMVRISGMQFLLSAVSGGSGGDLISSAAGLAALLRYSREAEREADGFARDVLTKSAIDPTGFRHFFEKIKKIGGEKDVAEGETKSALDRIGDVFSTHPGTEERIKEIQPLPKGVTPRVVMTDVQWKALKDACR